MRKLMFLIALSVITAGQVKATSCGGGTTVADYIALGSAGCTIVSGGDTWTFFNFAYQSPTANAPTSSQLDLSFLTSGGIGFEVTPTVAWSASGGDTVDGELQYAVTVSGPGASITSLFQSVTGTVTPPQPTSAGFDNITDTYCPGVTSLPPSCSMGPTLYSTLTSNGTASNTATFSSVTGVGVKKDVSANSSGYPGSTDTVTQFINCFDGTCAGTTPPTPEPGSLLMLGSGLLGLALLSVRRRRSLV